MLPRISALAGADVDDVWIGRGDGDGADRRAGDLTVGHRLPRRAAVGRLPQAAAGGAEVVLERTRGAAGDGDRAPAALRARGCASATRRTDPNWPACGGPPRRCAPGAAPNRSRRRPRAAGRRKGVNAWHGRNMAVLQRVLERSRSTTAAARPAVGGPKPPVAGATRCGAGSERHSAEMRARRLTLRPDAAVL